MNQKPFRHLISIFITITAISGCHEVMAASVNTNNSQLLVNEALCFLTTQFDCLDRETLSKALHDFYSTEEIVDSKQILITECEKVTLTNSITDFKTKCWVNSANAKEKIVKDIVDIWDVVDKDLGGKLSCQFVAANPLRLPSVNADKFNIQFLITSILNLREEVSHQKETLDSVTESLTSITSRLPNPTPVSVTCLPLLLPGTEVTPTTSKSNFCCTQFLAPDWNGSRFYHAKINCEKEKTLSIGADVHANARICSNSAISGLQRSNAIYSKSQRCVNKSNILRRQSRKS